MKKLLVFTDLDGSLLNHYNYSWAEAVLALTALDDNAFPVIFTSSKTAAEIIKLKKNMANRHPFICENGAIANIPENYFNLEDIDNHVVLKFHSHFFAMPYQQIIETLTRLRNDYQYKFRGFNDMAIDDLIALTNLDEEQALNAKQRQASEPLIWKDTSEALNEFRKYLEQEDLIVTSGGRFYHVMSDVNKGEAVEWLLEQYRQAEPATEWITVGLGDSFNDVQMLEVVDYPIFISNSGTRQPDLSHIKNLQRPQLPGPAGWNQAILSLMTKIL